VGVAVCVGMDVEVDVGMSVAGAVEGTDVVIEEVACPLHPTITSVIKIVDNTIRPQFDMSLPTFPID